MNWVDWLKKSVSVNWFVLVNCADFVKKSDLVNFDDWEKAFEYEKWDVCENKCDSVNFVDSVKASVLENWIDWENWCDLEK